MIAPLRTIIIQLKPAGEGANSQRTFATPGRLSWLCGHEPHVNHPIPSLTRQPSTALVPEAAPLVGERRTLTIDGGRHYLWRAVKNEGEVLESLVRKARNRKAALKFLKKTTRRRGSPKTLVTDKLRSYCAAMKVVGNADRQETGRSLKIRAENSHPLPDSGLLANHEKGPFRRRERAMLRFRRLRTLQKYVAVHSSVHNHFDHERSGIVTLTRRSARRRVISSNEQNILRTPSISAINNPEGGLALLSLPVELSRY